MKEGLFQVPSNRSLNNTSDVNNEDQMEVYDCPKCFLCGSDGEALYEGLKDRLFNVPGIWNSRKCGNANCGLVWLDPMPREDQIHKAYVTYYTHQNEEKTGRRKGGRSIHERLLGLHKKLLKAYAGGKAASENHYLMYLRGVSPGRLLEVGCGSGKRLARLEALGWQVEGQEVDEKAYAAAKQKYNFPIHLGDLKSLSLESGTFDTIVLNHVIEHVHQPIELLTEARRLLKPGGSLVVITPNAESQEHLLFKQNWFSLDPPRHLHIFTPRALSMLARDCGFSKYETWTAGVNSDYVVASSIKIQTQGDMKASEDRIAKLKRIIAGIYFQLWGKASSTYLPDNGEECVLKAIK